MVDFTVYKGSKDGKIVKSTTSKQVAPDEVLLRVQFSGLCGTDIHFKSVDMALGHEGVGIVEQLGKDVKTLKM
jgi:threonine dehydrogenase-like Zn-dependent dehydrogenase